MKKTFSIAYALIAILSFGCKKTDKTNRASQVALLTDVNWIITNEERYSGGTWVQDTSFAKKRSCNFDNFMHFTTDGNYEHNFGSVSCDTTRFEYPFTNIWLILEDTPNKILFNGALEADINQLDKNNFQYTYPYTYRVTLSH